MNVFIENSVKNAIHTIKKLNPSVVVLDYYLEEDVSAKDVMKSINEMEDRPKVIMLSSMTNETEKKEVMAMGVERFIPKSNESIYDLVKEIQDQLSDIMPATDVLAEKDGNAKIGILGMVLLVLVALVWLAS